MVVVPLTAGEINPSYRTHWLEKRDIWEREREREREREKRKREREGGLYLLTVHNSNQIHTYKDE